MDTRAIYGGSRNTARDTPWTAERHPLETPGQHGHAPGNREDHSRDWSGADEIVSADPNTAEATSSSALQIHENISPPRAAASDEPGGSDPHGEASRNPDGGFPAPASPGRSTLRRDQEQQVLDRADHLLREGQIAGARLWLERAVRQGSAEAAYRLAETYDPHVLSRWGAVGVFGNGVRARELYEKAQTGGYLPAMERLSGLR